MRSLRARLFVYLIGGAAVVLLVARVRPENDRRRRAPDGVRPGAPGQGAGPGRVDRAGRRPDRVRVRRGAHARVRGRRRAPSTSSSGSRTARWFSGPRRSRRATRSRAASLVKSPHPAATPTLPGRSPARRPPGPSDPARFRPDPRPGGRAGRGAGRRRRPPRAVEPPDGDPARRARARAARCRHPPPGADRGRRGRRPDARARRAHAARPPGRPPLPGPVDRSGAGARRDLPRRAGRPWRSRPTRSRWSSSR